MIDRTHQLCISRQAQLLGISRGSVYYQPKQVSEEDLVLMRKLDELHLEYPFMGARMLRDQLNRIGFTIGRKRVSTLMKLLLSSRTKDSARLQSMLALTTVVMNQFWVGT